MEDALVMNRLPLPKYFDGNEWNTVIKPSRRSIPKYLHQDLPALKHLYIKEKFKQIGKFNCPKLQYFDKMIKNKKVNLKALEKKTSKSPTKNRSVSYNQIKQQLQYALIIADKESNIIDGLLQKAKLCNTEPLSIQKRKKNHRLSLARETGKYFSNTVELVFRQRKKQFLETQNIVDDPDTTEVDQRINTIKLLKFEG